MEDGRVLLDYGVRDSSMIHVIIRRGKGCLTSSPVRQQRTAALESSPKRQTARPKTALMWGDLATGLDEPRRSPSSGESDNGSLSANLIESESISASDN